MTKTKVKKAEIVGQDMVRHVSRLARLSLREDEIIQYQKDLEGILEYMEELKEVDTQGVEPLTNPMREQVEFFINDRDFRMDQIHPSLGAQEILKNAPDSHLNQFRLNAIIEEA